MSVTSLRSTLSWFLRISSSSLLNILFASIYVDSLSSTLYRDSCRVLCFWVIDSSSASAFSSLPVRRRISTELYYKSADVEASPFSCCLSVPTSDSTASGYSFDGWDESWVLLVISSSSLGYSTRPDSFGGVSYSAAASDVCSACSDDDVAAKFDSYSTKWATSSSTFCSS